MMKFFYTIIIFLVIVLSATIKNGMCSQMSQQRICVADIHLIFQQSDAERKAKLELELKQKEMGVALDKLGQEIDKLNESLQRESMVMNNQAKIEKERDLRIKVNDLKYLKIKFQEELDMLQQKLISDIEKEIISIASEIGKSAGYSMVINKSAVLYSDQTIDITNSILNKYNTKYNKRKNIK